ncbi:FSR family fosmidomycin resistance protein-like MFS transporter [Caldalkalibacillus uzonensis]|uniref:FSR family fosmidomycin resistance protein-like MFS transporter n=1 Tax=Caldalkalibacillus uzonensis TaxID=353224 RepID=A0ABU0CYC9_9BACI|nr:MFS transporter [Caldalkalibacillus uzonensis]MDQ0341139.1 FSR family fosmidomycin resistance protein-like MFS transporter [Caldalkalibacillus uzonensis]
MTNNNATQTIYPILLIIGFVHLLTDAIQSVIPAMFPILEQSMGLTFLQLGIIAFALNMTSSIMQPVVGWLTDKRPSPFALPIGLCFTLVGIIGIAVAPSFWYALLSALLIGLGSATFHPEGSRVAYMAAGNRRGLAQSIYQVGGNTGQAMAPLITALILVPLGQFGAIWFTIVTLIAIALLLYIASWYRTQLQEGRKKKSRQTVNQVKVGGYTIGFALCLLVFLVFARSWYHAAITNFYAFYLIEQYQLTIRQSQVYIFLFLAAGAIGTFAGGPLADRFGKRNILFFSMVGSAPLALWLPHAGPLMAYVLMTLIGFIILSSFAVVVVYAQELLPGKIGMVSGLIVGLAFGMGAIGSVALGWLADLTGLRLTMIGVACLPLVGLLAILLPADQTIKTWYTPNLPSQGEQASSPAGRA